MGAWPRPTLVRRMGALIIGFAVVQGGAQAGDLFSVAGVRIDAIAESAQAAQQAALRRGQATALRSMFKKLTLVADHPRLPSIDRPMIDRLMRSYQVTSERRSAQRYVAKITVYFDPDRVRETLRLADIPYAETVSPTSLVLAVLVDQAGARLWASPNDWRLAWENFNRGGRLVNLAMPYGELADISAVSADQALTGDQVALATIAARYGANDVVVAIAQPQSPNQLMVELHRHGETATLLLRGTRDLALAAPAEPDLAAVAEGDPLTPDETEDQDLAATRRAAYGTVIAEIVAVLEQDWIAANLLDFGVVTGVAVAVPLSGLGQWLNIRARLEALSQIERIEINSLSPVVADLTLHYLGSESRLVTALRARKLALVDNGEEGRTLEDMADAPIDPLMEQLLDQTAAGTSGPLTPNDDHLAMPDADIPGTEPDFPLIDDLLVE